MAVSGYANTSSTIKNIKGEFYSYIVLLFNENPHFVNLIQKDNVPTRILGDDGFHIKSYKRYLKTIRYSGLKYLAKLMLNVYLEPRKYSEKRLSSIEKKLVKWNVILRFSRDRNLGNDKITLKYCIYGKRARVNISHPLLQTKEKIYNIQPFIYYDEFSTSSSTFYYDMIYIHPGEVTNDYVIACKVKEHRDVKSLFFVGSAVTDDIKYCLKKAYQNKRVSKGSIWKIFIVHELTHKLLNNKFNNYNQITGEELSLCSTIYSNPYLGLAIMYSYLNYASINPHRIAAMNFIRYVAVKTNKLNLIKKPELVKHLSYRELKQAAKNNFFEAIKKLK